MVIACDIISFNLILMENSTTTTKKIKYSYAITTTTNTKYTHTYSYLLECSKRNWPVTSLIFRKRNWKNWIKMRINYMRIYVLKPNQQWKLLFFSLWPLFHYVPEKLCNVHIYCDMPTISLKCVAVIFFFFFLFFFWNLKYLNRLADIVNLFSFPF